MFARPVTRSLRSADRPVRRHRRSNIAQLINMVFGNTSLQPHVELGPSGPAALRRRAAARSQRRHCPPSRPGRRAAAAADLHGDQAPGPPRCRIGPASPGPGTRGHRPPQGRPRDGGPARCAGPVNRCRPASLQWREQTQKRAGDREHASSLAGRPPVPLRGGLVGPRPGGSGGVGRLLDAGRETRRSLYWSPPSVTCCSSHTRPLGARGASPRLCCWARCSDGRVRMR